MDSREALSAGTFLDGSYRIKRVVGVGGFGITYEAFDENLDTQVAIKEYFPHEFGGREGNFSVHPRSEWARQSFEWGRSNFLKEARTLAGFEHRAIVRVLRVFEAHSTAYMVMRFENGTSLEKWLRGLGRAPTQEELDFIVEPLLDALELMHKANYLHRDIAPDNVIVRPDGTPVLLDFGSARHVVAEMSRSLTGVVKAGYSPHEQYSVDGRRQGPWTDLYALGGTLYRAVTGMPPHESTLRFDQDYMPAASEVGKESYRPEFLKAIDHCLKVRPSERPQSVAELRPRLLRQKEPTTARKTVSRSQSAVASVQSALTSVTERLPPLTKLPALASDRLAALPGVPRNALAGVAILGLAVAGGAVGFAVFKQSSWAIVSQPTPERPKTDDDTHTQEAARPDMARPDDERRFSPSFDDKREEEERRRQAELQRQRDEADRKAETERKAEADRRDRERLALLEKQGREKADAERRERERKDAERREQERLANLEKQLREKAEAERKEQERRDKIAAEELRKQMETRRLQSPPAPDQQREFVTKVVAQLKRFKCFEGLSENTAGDPQKGIERLVHSYPRLGRGKAPQLNLVSGTVGDFETWLRETDAVKADVCAAPPAAAPQRPVAAPRPAPQRPAAPRGGIMTGIQ